MEELCFLCGPCRDVTTEEVRSLVSEKSVRRELPFREDLSAEAEESPLLEAVTRERLVKTQQAVKDLSCAVVIRKVWRLAMAL
jgi:hypothetical protein